MAPVELLYFVGAAASFGIFVAAMAAVGLNLWWYFTEEK